MRSPFKPIGIPPEAWDRLFEEIKPTSDGRKRWRFRHPLLKDGPILTECPPQKPIHCELIERKPLKVPIASIFFLDYRYGDE